MQSLETVKKVNELGKELFALSSKHTFRESFRMFVKYQKPTQCEISSLTNRSTSVLRGLFDQKPVVIADLLFHSVRDPLAKSFHLLSVFCEAEKYPQLIGIYEVGEIMPVIARIVFYLENGCKLMDEFFCFDGQTSSFKSSEVDIFIQKMHKSLKEIRMNLSRLLEEMGVSEEDFNRQISHLKNLFPKSISGVDSLVALNIN